MARAGVDQSSTVGDVVRLDGNGSSDPDGDSLTYRWWQYQEPGAYTGTIQIQNENMQEASFVVPEDATAGQTIHVICEVTDNGTPPLTRYQRVIVTVNP